MGQDIIVAEVSTHSTSWSKILPNSLPWMAAKKIKEELQNCLVRDWGLLILLDLYLSPLLIHILQLLDRLFPVPSSRPSQNGT